jgi:hypothetical protein
LPARIAPVGSPVSPSITAIKKDDDDDNDDSDDAAANYRTAVLVKKESDIKEEPSIRKELVVKREPVIKQEPVRQKPPSNDITRTAVIPASARSVKMNTTTTLATPGGISDPALITYVGKGSERIMVWHG